MSVHDVRLTTGEVGPQPDDSRGVPARSWLVADINGQRVRAGW
jgi:hypothetical protein